MADEENAPEDPTPECYTNPHRSVTSLSQSAIQFALEDISKEQVPPPDVDDSMFGAGSGAGGGAGGAGGGFGGMSQAEWDAYLNARYGIYPYKSTASLDSFDRLQTGMNRDLSNEVIQIYPSDEYLESHQHHCTQMVASLDRLFTEDEDDDHPGDRPVPILSQGRRPKNYYNNFKSPEVSIASTVTDYGELFPDRGPRPIGDCGSCDNCFTDDEVAGGWHMYSIDRDSDYSDFNQAMYRPSKANERIPPSKSSLTCEEAKRHGVDRCKKERYPEDTSIRCKQDGYDRCHRADGVNPSTRRSQSSRRGSRKYEDETVRRSSRRRRKEKYEASDSSDEKDRKSSRRRSRRENKHQDEGASEEKGRSNRRSSRRSHRRERYDEDGYRKYRSDESSDTEVERRSHRQVKEKKSKGDCLLQSLQEASNVCFFKNPFYTAPGERRNTQFDESSDEDSLYGRNPRYDSKGDALLRSLREARNISYFKNPFFNDTQEGSNQGSRRGDDCFESTGSERSYRGGYRNSRSDRKQSSGSMRRSSHNANYERTILPDIKNPYAPNDEYTPRRRKSVNAEMKTLYPLQDGPYRPIRGNNRAIHA